MFTTKIFFCLLLFLSFFLSFFFFLFFFFFIFFNFILFVFDLFVCFVFWVFVIPPGINQTQWSTIPVCPIPDLFLREISERTNSSKICVLYLSMHILFYVCARIYCFCRFHLSKGLRMRIVLIGTFPYDRTDWA